MNLIRADLYAVLRGKAIYITFGIMLLLNILVIGTRSVAGVNLEGLEVMALDIPEFTFDGLGSFALLYTRMDNNVYFLLPLILAGSAQIFKFGTVKNDLTCGISRTKLYLSKLLISIGLCIFMMLFYMVTGVFLFAFFLNTSCDKNFFTGIWIKPRIKHCCCQSHWRWGKVLNLFGFKI